MAPTRTVVTSPGFRTPIWHRSRFLWAFLLILGLIAWADVPVRAQPVVPAGFQIEQVGGGFFPAATMAIAPDGRIFITEKNRGTIRVVKNDILLPQPFVDLAVNFCGERGAVGICLDPDFETNGWVYLSYTRSNTGADNGNTGGAIDEQLVRFTASGDTALAGSETLIRSFPINPVACFHNFGNIHFGPDDTLMVWRGDGLFDPTPSLDLSVLPGKFLRLDVTTGQAAPGNFFASDGDPLTLPEIWAYGLRNSFDFTWHPVTGKIFATENGPANDDEINVIEEGLQYGWPIVEGFADTPAESTFAANNPNYRDPVWSTADSVVCPTGIVVVHGGPWEAILGKSLLVGQCLPFAGGQRIIRLPLGGAQGDSVNGPEEIFAFDFPSLITDIEFDSEDRLYVLVWTTLWRISLDGTVAAPPPTGRPGSVLSHHGAHPSLSAASVRYQLSGEGPAELTIVDARGRRVRVLEGGIVGPGIFVARWDGNDDSGRRVPSGVYYYRLVEDGQVQSLSVVRIR